MDVVEAIRRQGYMDVSKLSSVILLARYIVNQRVEDTRKLIESYFEIGVEELEESRLKSLLGKLVEKARSHGIGIRIRDHGVDVYVPREVRRYERSHAKQVRARAFVYAVAATLLSHRLMPDLTIALIPYGYSGDVKRYLHEASEELDEALPLEAPLHTYKVENTSGKAAIAKESLEILRKLVREREPIAIVVAAFGWQENIIYYIGKRVTDRIIVPVVLRYA